VLSDGDGNPRVSIPTGTATATVPNATGTVMVSGNQPAFSAYLSANQTISNQTIPIGTATPYKREGNIDNILKSICIHLGIDDFASTTQQKRFFGRHLWLLFQKRGKDEFVRRLDILKNDSFEFLLSRCTIQKGADLFLPPLSLSCCAVS